ncbi:MAG: phosphoglucomutase/phosphomannomutase family protein [bacterium]
MPIVFGTDGWRDVIAEDFTFANVRRAAWGIAEFLLSPARENLKVYRGRPGIPPPSPFRPASAGVLVGYDTRFLSDLFAEETARVLAARGIPVWLAQEADSTPAISFAVKEKQACGAIVITASHNPPRYNGMKYKAEYAGSGLPEMMEAIAAEVGKIGEEHSPLASETLAPIQKFLPRTGYLEHLEDLVDIVRIAAAGFKIIADPMHGASRGYLKSLLSSAGGNCLEIRGELNPSFGGVNPEPIEKNLKALIEAVRADGAAVGLAFDGDGDRIGAVDSNGEFVNPHQIIALVFCHLIRNRKWSGAVARTISTTRMLDILAKRFGLPLFETPVGFKHICSLMLTEDVLIGGEESGGIGFKNHIPERDGILSALLLLEAMACEKKNLVQLLDSLREEIGTFSFKRMDAPLSGARSGGDILARLTEKAPEFIREIPVAEVLTSDGVKYVLEDDSWLLFRFSGTEPLLRIYAEASSAEKANALILAGKKLALGG